MTLSVKSGSSFFWNKNKQPDKQAPEPEPIEPPIKNRTVILT